MRCLRPLPALALLLTACGSGAGDMAAQLEAWQLPPDLITRQAQLTELHLPEVVDRLTWLDSERLEAISAHGSGLRSLEGIPRSVERLDVTFTSIASLEHLPPSARALDLRSTSIRQAIGLPPTLERLALSGSAAANLRYLPATLQRLDLERANVAVLRGFPPSLESLTVFGGDMDALEGLPEGLEHLRLNATGLRSLPSLPRSLQTLELVQNPTLHLPRLPHYLQHLVLDNQRIAEFGGLRYLETLEIRGEASSIPGSLPRSLERFHVDLYGEPAAPVLPPDLQELGLLRWNGPLPSMPASIESLDLSDYAGEALDLGSYRLRSLKVAGVEGVQAFHLPRGLESLDASGARLPGLQERLKSLDRLQSLRCWSCSLELAELPPNLTELDVRDSRRLQRLGPLPAKLESLNVSRTAISDLGDLKQLPALRKLDISNSSIREPLGLPEGLHELTVHAGQLRSLAALPGSVRILRFVERD